MEAMLLPRRLACKKTKEVGGELKRIGIWFMVSATPRR
jgi:hypothetical protein